MRTTRTTEICRVAMVVLLLFASNSLMCMAEGTMSKAMQKECKRMFKELKKEGWKVFDGHSTDLKTALESYYEELEAGGSNVRSHRATATAINVNLAKSKAKARATQDYASQLRSEVESITSIGLQNIQEGDDITSKKEMENNLTVKVEQMVKGMAPVLTLRRESGDKTDVLMLFILKHIGADETDE